MKGIKGIFLSTLVIIGVVLFYLSIIKVGQASLATEEEPKVPGFYLDVIKVIGGALGVHFGAYLGIAIVHRSPWGSEQSGPLSCIYRTDII